MATGLEVWIARPGSACRMDDGSWLVTVYDAHNQVFEWAGMSYANMAAPNAHWAGSIPPGTYVVRAKHKTTGVQTDHAIAYVHCGEAVCVHLYVAGKKPDRPDRPSDDHHCAIEIREVVGIDGPIPSAIEVTGHATGCKSVRVTLTCSNEARRELVVPVSASGQWLALFKELQELNCRCHRMVAVVAQCVEHRECMDRYQSDKLNCRDDRPK
jgi:hypothetical protein